MSPSDHTEKWLVSRHCLGHGHRFPWISYNQTIPWIGKINDNGSATEFVAAGIKVPPAGQKRTMDCIDRHNRTPHSFDTAEDALNKDMALGSPSVSLPFVHKDGLALIKTQYTSRDAARAAITPGLVTSYRSQYAYTERSARAGQTGRGNPGHHLQHKHLSVHEGYVGDASP